MASNTVHIEKYIYQIRYKPSLHFYEKLFKLDKIFSGFQHWQTDRLRISLRDYEKKHSLTIKHDSTTFESDKPAIKSAKKIIKTVQENFHEYSNSSDIQRLGGRYLGFIKNELSFAELNEILKLKVFNKDFLNSINKEEVFDHSIVFNSVVNNLTLRINIGPIKKVEIPHYIQFNSENHIDQNSLEKYSELANIYSNYPDHSLFFDLDVFTDISKSDSFDIMQFLEDSNKAFETQIDDLRNFIFQEKLK